MDIARSLFETLKSLCRILGDARVEYCLIGGLAVGILSTAWIEPFKRRG